MGISYLSMIPIPARNGQSLPAGILLLLIIIGLIVLVIYKARIFKAAQTPFPMNWFCFYTYFQLPCGVIDILNEFDKMGKVSFFGLGLIALIVAVFIGLHKRKLWGWYLNWVLFAIGVLTKILFYPVGDLGGTQFEKIGFFAGCLLAGLLYTLANVMYFWKRKVLFT